jgi:hypothetical protein
MNMDAGTAEIVETTATGQPVRLVLTSIIDVARFLVAALEIDLNTWPEEFRMQGDRMTVAEIVYWAGIARGCELIGHLSSEYADKSSGTGYEYHSSQRFARSFRRSDILSRLWKSCSHL